MANYKNDNLNIELFFDFKAKKSRVYKKMKLFPWNVFKSEYQHITDTRPEKDWELCASMGLYDFPWSYIKVLLIKLKDVTGVSLGRTGKWKHAGADRIFTDYEGGFDESQPDFYTYFGLTINENEKLHQYYQSIGGNENDSDKKMLTNLLYEMDKLVANDSKLMRLLYKSLIDAIKRYLSDDSNNR